ncbi:MAG: GNAT family protein, partial [Eubacteriales bacterium]
MILRELKLTDAPSMLEWMHDETISQQFRFDTMGQTQETVEAFIKKSMNDAENKHFAIVDESDEYMGTISLKHIDNNDKTAEYAIVLRKKAQGQGLARQATRALLEKAFIEYGLNKVYLNVLSQNKRAIRFYESFGFKPEGEFKSHIMLSGEPKDLKWYAVFKKDYMSDDTDNVRMIKFNQLGDERGHLVVMEQ